MTWCSKWLNHGRIIVLMKSIVEFIPAYWISFPYVPIGTLEQIHKLCYIFLWKGKPKEKSYAWVAWNKIVPPKDLGGWGLKHPILL